MSGFAKPIDPITALAQRITALETQIRDLSTPQPFRIPVLSADPVDTDPTNIWAFPDGRIRWRHYNTAGTAYVIREVAGTSPGTTTTGTVIAPPAPAPVSQQGSWAATYTQSYRQSGAARTDGGATSLYYGSSGDGFNGRNRSLIGFDYTAIAAALAGAEIQNVWIRMVNEHSWYNSGSDAHLGIHNFIAEPGSWAGGGIPRSMLVKVHWNKGQDLTARIPIDFAQAIRDGWGKGVAIESPSDSRTYYGFMGGIGSGYQPPVLIIQYAK